MRARRASRPSKLVDTRPLVYEVPGQPPIWRNCRTWSLPDGTTVSIVTEHPDDTGMSITNAASEVRAALERNWGVGCRIVEHYPWPSGEHWDEQYRLYPDVIRWRRLSDAEVRAITHTTH